MSEDDPEDLFFQPTPNNCNLNPIIPASVTAASSCAARLEPALAAFLDALLTDVDVTQEQIKAEFTAWCNLQFQAACSRHAAHVSASSPAEQQLDRMLRWLDNHTL